MAKKKAAKKPRKKTITCKKCKNSFDIGSPDDKRKKEWTLTSPMPDKNGNVTITAMATWDCPKCGKNITGSAGKTKSDFSGKSKKTMIEDKIAENVSFNVAELAKEIGVDENNLTKILIMKIKKGTANGKLSDGKYTPA